MTDVYASGDWRVLPGREEEFTSRWKDWLSWTKEFCGDDLERATLMRDERDASHFVSVGEWASVDSRAAWQQDPEFTRHYERCSELCTAVESSPFAEAAKVR